MKELNEDGLLVINAHFRFEVGVIATYKDKGYELVRKDVQGTNIVLYFKPGEYLKE